jgi:hypothetical protein
VPLAFPRPFWAPRFPAFAPTPLSTIITNACPEALDLISQLCAWDPAKRPTVQQVLAHPYFQPARAPPRGLSTPPPLPAAERRAALGSSGGSGSAGSPAPSRRSARSGGGGAERLSEGGGGGGGPHVRFLGPGSGNSGGGGCGKAPAVNPPTCRSDGSLTACRDSGGGAGPAPLGGSNSAPVPGRPFAAALQPVRQPGSAVLLPCGAAAGSPLAGSARSVSGEAATAAARTQQQLQLLLPPCGVPPRVPGMAHRTSAAGPSQAAVAAITMSMASVLSVVRAGPGGCSEPGMPGLHGSAAGARPRTDPPAAPHGALRVASSDGGGSGPSGATQGVAAGSAGPGGGLYQRLSGFKRLF